MDTVREVLIEEMRDLYDAEKMLVKALPKMSRAASSDQLQQAIDEHLEQTRQQVARLERAFEMIGESPKKKPCVGMRGLIEEGQDVLEEDRSEHTDLAIIGAAQRVEHYEIAAYGTARTLAESLGFPEAAELLQETLDEEKEADRKLSSISESMLRDLDAAHESEREEAEIATAAPRRSAGRAGGRQQSNNRRARR